MENMLLVEKKDGAACLTIRNPEKRNALTPGLLTELHRNLVALSEDNAVRCVIIRGDGDKVFSSGYDISAIPAGKPENEGADPPDILFKALAAVKAFPYPTIAMLNGHAFGAGFNLSACCDIRIAADDIRVGMPPARLGVAYHAEGVQQFIEAFGMARTKEIFYTAQIYQGEELFQKGLVNYLIPKSELESFTHEFAQKIARHAPLSLRGIKEVISMFEKKIDLDKPNLDKAGQWVLKCLQSEDLKEGQAAFMEKRTPQFKGK